ncbi:hypothetical protein BGX27_009105, partial [Mortierella sp. AM989]
KEPSRKKLGAMQAILKVLLESDTIQGKITRTWIEKTAFTGTKFTEKEFSVMILLANALRPYVPKRRPGKDGQHSQPPLPHVALRCPIVMIANSVLRATGYSQYARQISPTTFISEIHAFTKCFDPNNKRAVIGAFFDLQKIDAICKSHGLEFRNSLRIRLLGAVIPNGDQRTGHPIRSQLETRKKKERGKSRMNPWVSQLAELGMTKDEVKSMADSTANEIKEVLENLAIPRKERSRKREAQKSARHHHNQNKSAESYDKLRKARLEARDAQRDIIPQEAYLKKLRQHSYAWNKLSTVSLSSSSSGNNPAVPILTTPTWDHPTVEDDVKHMDLSVLQTSCMDTPKTLVFSGSDYGIRKMSQTVALSQNTIFEHLNYYHALSDSTVEIPEEFPHVPKGNTITAGKINNSSFTNKMRTKREQRLRKPENRNVSDALKVISDKDNSLSRATSGNDIDVAHEARKEVRDVLRSFENSSKRQKEKKTQELRTTRTWNKVGAEERRHIKSTVSTSSETESDGFCKDCQVHHIPEDGNCGPAQCPKTTADVLPVMFVGDAGTGVGSRIQGHARRGGKKLRVEHQKHCPVVLTDEYNSSKTCIYCFEQLSKASSRRIVNSHIRTVSVNGALECVNPDCVSFLVGYTIKSRDAHSAVAIALAGASALLPPTNKVLRPFSRHIQLGEILKKPDQKTGTTITAPNIDKNATGAPLLGGGL